jgi:allophanate hydrolase
MPLNGQLQAAGARLAQVSTTSQSYRLFAIPNTHPPKPGLVRVDEGGQTIALEVYDVPAWAVSDFLKGIAAPLGLGNVELSSGQWVTGFICEPAALKGARDITEFGGWRAYMQVMAAAKETDRTRETEA